MNTIEWARLTGHDRDDLSAEAKTIKELTGEDPEDILGNDYENEIAELADEKPAPEEIKIKCYNCGEEFETQYACHLSGEIVCPTCYDEMTVKPNLTFEL